MFFFTLKGMYVYIARVIISNNFLAIKGLLTMQTLFAKLYWICECFNYTSFYIANNPEC